MMAKDHETPLFQLKSSSQSLKMLLKWAWLAVRRREGVGAVWPLLSMSHAYRLSLKAVVKCEEMLDFFYIAGKVKVL